ncbi:MAG: AgmX/PglI C-terminal domain-containing protein [Deltaproteobacteria bacterium]|nr:AgmX/PglI C-terminal domain-containing protein [Deltaproteobacteria bacterium]
MPRRTGIEVAFVLAATAIGCGAPATPAAGPQMARTGGAGEESDGVSAEGLLGDISAEDVQRVIENNEEALAACYGKALEVEESIEGALRIRMEVSPSGRAESAFIEKSDLGSLEAEECILARVESFSYPRSRGGNARVSYPLVLTSPYTPPRPEVWPSSRLDAVAAGHDAEVRQCLAGATGVEITLWVGPGGRALSAGAAAFGLEAYEGAACVARAAMNWTYPDPGASPAKATLSF